MTEKYSTANVGRTPTVGEKDIVIKEEDCSVFALPEEHFFWNLLIPIWKYFSDIKQTLLLLFDLQTFCEVPLAVHQPRNADEIFDKSCFWTIYEDDHWSNHHWFISKSAGFISRCELQTNGTQIYTKLSNMQSIVTWVKGGGCLLYNLWWKNFCVYIVWYQKHFGPANV